MEAQEKKSTQEKEVPYKEALEQIYRLEERMSDLARRIKDEILQRKPKTDNEEGFVSIYRLPDNKIIVTEGKHTSTEEPEFGITLFESAIFDPKLRKPTKTGGWGRDCIQGKILQQVSLSTSSGGGVCFGSDVQNQDPYLSSAVNTRNIVNFSNMSLEVHLPDHEIDPLTQAESMINLIKSGGGKLEAQFITGGGGVVPIEF